MVLKQMAFAAAVLLMAFASSAQSVQTVALDQSDFPPAKVLHILQKKCPNVKLREAGAKTDVVFSVRKGSRYSLLGRTIDVSITDETGRVVNLNDDNLNHAITGMCQIHGWDIVNPILVDVVDTSNLTQSADLRNVPGSSLAESLTNAMAGRRTHTDASTMSVIANGEHAFMDCYERKKGCMTIAPGHYFGKLKGNGIWITFIMPLTHAVIRNHYKIAGSW